MVHYDSDTYRCKRNSQGSNPYGLLLPRPPCRTNAVIGPFFSEIGRISPWIFVRGALCEGA